MLDGVEVFTQSSIKIAKGVNIYIDPFKIEQNFHDANYIFITHDHYDHFDPDSIFKVKKDNTKIIIPKLLSEKVKELGFSDEDILEVIPHNNYKIDNLEFFTVPSYNINKSFHPKENGWVGYIINISNIKFYISGDTDDLEENEHLDCDVALIPIGGVFTMDYKEAANFINVLNPKMVVPTHYGSIVGRITDGKSFEKLLNNNITCVRLLEHD